MDKDKEILFNKDIAKKFADLVAKCLMPDVEMLENLSSPNTDVTVCEEDGQFKWTYKIKE